MQLSGLELKVPPVLSVAVAAVLMWWGRDRLRLPMATAFEFPIRVCGFAMTAGALMLLIFCALQFRKQQTTVDPLHPAETTQLVTHGVYAFSRNPMYLAMAIALAGWALVLMSPASLWVVRRWL